MSSNMFSKNSKTESTASLIPRNLKSPSQFLSWGSKGSSAQLKNNDGKTTTLSAPKSDSDFAKKARANGWNAPTAARPSLGGF
ncbi:hypothetical protein E1B28_012825 [Marasmius oreades]|uniref:Uncharacterized protein n=1 Tax=Marasmius oreades TaxID=181124 RepID=A0A9P7UQC5_9AGAR|nr:uncharacterized protein E1B28_012825 [Marasmius oreades]KAG7088876.1 hypothetical protein E1B28_012825 [Marasmius oreades]